MDDLQQLKDRLAQLRLIPSPELKIVIAMNNIESMIKEREKKNGK